MLTKITLKTNKRDELQQLTGLNIVTRTNFSIFMQKNDFGQNKDKITELMEQGRQNALIYLERNKLGQKLSLFEENNLFLAVAEIQKKLGLNTIPRRIECYDISHLSGTFVYGSMVTFVDGRAAKKFYKLFKTKEQNNDFENHREVMIRRLRRHLENPDNIDWGLPDLIIVDGGKGQLSSDFGVLKDFGLESKIEMVGLAKREEEVFVVDSSRVPSGAEIGSQGGILLTGQAKFLIQRIRDEAHRFAITNNRKARLKTVQKSSLEDIKGIGPKTKTKVLQVFGSLPNFLNAVTENKELVIELIGEAKYNLVKEQI